MKPMSAVLLLLCTFGLFHGCSQEIPRVWKEHEIFREKVYRLCDIGTLIEILKIKGDYPKTDSHEIKSILRDQHELVYFCPAKYSDKPFDLIWIGRNEKFDEGKEDDVPLWEVSERLCDEEGQWRWYSDRYFATKTQYFYEEWYEKNKEK